MASGYRTGPESGRARPNHGQGDGSDRTAELPAFRQVERRGRRATGGTGIRVTYEKRVTLYE